MSVTRRIQPLQQSRRVGVRHEAGRVCDVWNCDTRLSIYNGEDRCSLHEGFPDHSLNGGVFLSSPRQSG